MTNSIYYKDGIFVAIGDWRSYHYVNTDKINCIIFHKEHRQHPSIFGGRVKISPTEDNIRNRRIKLYVDGVPIYWLSPESATATDRLDVEEIVSFLNAIEANGVNAFIEHYKQNVEFAYSELKELSQKTEMEISTAQDSSTIEKLVSELAKIKELLLSVLALLFNLRSFMPTGLENEKVISVYQSIMSSLA